MIRHICGKSNFTLTFSRKKDDNTINVLLATANITQGIISCMGFCSIDIENFTSIIKRLFSDSPAIKITPVALKSIYNYYYEKSIKNNIELPYELIVWKNIFNDTRTINYDISEFINSKLEIFRLKFSISDCSLFWILKSLLNSIEKLSHSIPLA